MTMKKGEDKVIRAMGEASESVNVWLASKPTGQLTINVEVNANQGGVGDIFIEVRERGKI